jgi:hypothetical protein
LLQLGERERAHEFEQLEPPVVIPAADEARFEQLIKFRARGAAKRGLERSEFEAAEERARTAERLPRRRREQVVTPSDRRPERLLAVGEVSQRAAPDRQRVRELLGDLGRGQYRSSRGRELDREGKSVERAADPRHRAPRRRIDREVAIRRERALEKHLDRRAVGDLVLVLARRQLERLDLEHALAAYPKRRPARYEHAQPRRHRQ